MLRDDVDLRRVFALPRFFELERFRVFAALRAGFFFAFGGEAFFTRARGGGAMRATVFLTAGLSLPSPAAFPAIAPTIPPTTAPGRPTMLPIAAPATAPAVSFGIGGTLMFSLAF